MDYNLQILFGENSSAWVTKASIKKKFGLGYLDRMGFTSPDLRMGFLGQDRDAFSGYFSVAARAKDTRRQARLLFMLNFAAFMLKMLNFPLIVG